MIENTIREIKEEKRAFSEIKDDFSKEKTKLTAKIESRIKKTNESSEKIRFNPGDSVAIEETGSVGIIIDIQADKNLALVEFNGLKFNLPISQLVASKPKVEKTRTIAEFFSFDAQSSIDVRGMRAEESLREIDNCIGKAIKANLDNLTIIHGKGTGALRAAIHQFLKHHHYIRSFRLGELVEGGAGVTIIELEH